MKIYLDVCCFNRPFDDQIQLKVKLESEAVVEIINRCKKGFWQLIGSEVVDYEISLPPDDERRARVTLLTEVVYLKIAIDQKIMNRALDLGKKEIKPFDALHIACAESEKVDIFLTTDINLLKRSNQKKLKVGVANPLDWLMEVINHEKTNNEYGKD